MLTVSNHDGDIAECRRLGVEDYIVKPVDFQNFSEVTPNLEMDWTLVMPPRRRVQLDWTGPHSKSAIRATWQCNVAMFWLNLLLEVIVRAAAILRRAKRHRFSMVPSNSR